MKKTHRFVPGDYYGKGSLLKISPTTCRMSKYKNFRRGGADNKVHRHGMKGKIKIPPWWACRHAGDPSVRKKISPGDKRAWSGESREKGT